MKKKISIIIYANPDHYPPVINTIKILSKEFDLFVICRNQGKVEQSYPSNVKLYRLGRPLPVKAKERQGIMAKAIEFINFLVFSILYTGLNRCFCVYAYDSHGYVCGYFASRAGRKKFLIYHNMELNKLSEVRGLSYYIKVLELKFAIHADKVVFADINRARYYINEAGLKNFPQIVLNAPLKQQEIPLSKMRERIGQDKKIILYEGVIDQNHYIPEVLDSMLSWPKEAVLVLRGYIAEEFKKRIYDFARLNKIEERIIFFPMVAYDQIFAYIAGAYLGLAFYKPMNINQMFNAGAANKIFEYLSMGIPALTNNSRYFRECLDERAVYFVDPESAENIAKTINLAFADLGGHQNKSSFARQIHLSEFNYDLQFRPVSDYLKILANYRA